MILAITVYLILGLLFNLWLIVAILPDIEGSKPQWPSLYKLLQAILLSPIGIFISLLCVPHIKNRTYKVSVESNDTDITFGGLFFVPRKGVLGYLIYKWQVAKNIPEPFCSYMHTGVTAKNKDGIHSSGATGVTKITILDKYPDAIFYQHKAIIADPAIAYTVINNAKKHLTKKYDLFSLIAFTFSGLAETVRHLLNLDPRASLFCSELDVRVYRAAGLPICLDTTNPENISPGMVAMDKNMVKL